VNFLFCPSIPKCARLLNSGETLRIRNCLLPGIFSGKTGKAKHPVVSLADIPADRYSEEPIILEVEW